jgi:hypothetical protein
MTDPAGPPAEDVTVTELQPTVDTPVQDGAAELQAEAERARAAGAAPEGSGDDDPATGTGTGTGAAGADAQRDGDPVAPEVGLAVDRPDAAAERPPPDRAPQ